MNEINKSESNEVAIVTPVSAFGQILGLADRKEKVLKSGAKVVGLLGKKEYALAHKLKGSANINRQYDLYVRKAGADNRVQAAALMASSRVSVRKMKLSEDGSKFSIEGDLNVKPEVDLSEVTEDQIGDLVERLRQLAPTAKIEFPKPAAVINV